MATSVIFQCHACKHTMEEMLSYACPKCGSVDIHILMALSRGGVEFRPLVEQREAREKIERWNNAVKGKNS